MAALASESKEGCTRIVVKEEDRGGPEKLVVETCDVPQCGEDQVVVRVKAAGVNFIDTYHRSGLYAGVTEIGLEGAGVIVAVGSSLTDEWRVADRVCWFAVQGSYANYVAIAPRQTALMRVPADIDLHTAAAIPLQSLTAHYLCNSTSAISRDTGAVLVHAGAGGTGGLLLQMCRALGCQCVITTVGTEAKKKQALALGAHFAILYKTEDFVSKVKEITHSIGCDVVFDGVGKSTYLGSLQSTKKRGLCVLFGNASGPVPPIDPLLLTQLGSLFITRPTLKDYVSDDELKQRSKDIFEWIAAGKLKIRIGERIPLSSAADAHRKLEDRQTTGKILLIP